MNILLAFAPFLVFVVLHHLVGVEPGLLAAVATSLLLLAKDAVFERKTPKILEIGTALLFGGLALFGAVKFTGRYPDRQRAVSPQTPNV